MIQESYSLLRRSKKVVSFCIQYDTQIAISHVKNMIPILRKISNLTLLEKWIEQYTQLIKDLISKFKDEQIPNIYENFSLVIPRYISFFTQFDNNLRKLWRFGQQ
ncbi:unnamed protein product [Paramecium octaurelia]|uniref:Uncharacterized protein n=1 Tax=Paramecium octaurelia TaxID=43137 RepID=A0A8S1XR50_PAROT|nr:unnamed protein product [Paramecium octaurelia]